MSLKDKLEKLNKETSSQKVDLERVKKDWLEKIDELYSQTNDWFDSYIKEGLFTVVEKEKKINEEHLGVYQTKQLEYEFGQNCLVIEPMGRNIIGAWGRVDVYFRGNKSDKYILVLLGEKFESATWYLSSFQDKRKRLEWNKENLEKLIENWIDKNTF